MRVLHLAPGPSRPSGIEAYARAFRASLEAHGVDVQRVDGGDLLPHEAMGFDLVHAELGGGCQPEFWAVTRIARAGDVPIVLTLHDPPRMVWRPFEVSGRSRAAGAGRALVTGRSARRAEAFLAARAAALFVLSDVAVAGVRAALAPAPGVQIRSLPFPGRQGDPPAPAPARSGFVVGFHGYWYRSKGIEVLLEALARTRSDQQPVRARLWGEPLPGAAGQGQRYRDQILSRIVHLGLQELVSVEGTIPDGHLHARLGEVDAVVLPYRRPSPAYAQLRSASASLADAIAAGVPVVASDVRAIRGQIRPGVDGLITPPDDPEALASSLRRLRDDSALLRRLRKGAAGSPGGDAAGTAAEVYDSVLVRVDAAAPA